MDNLNNDELLTMRKLLYKVWLRTPFYNLTSDTFASEMMDAIDDILKARNAYVSYDADYIYATASL
jgi:hypothetical protein